MRYDYNVIRNKGQQIEYAIYSYLDDGSFNDVENVITLNENDSIEQRIRNKYWPLLSDYEDK